MLGNLRQVGRVISTLPEQGMAIDAVVFVPDVLPQLYLGSDVVRVGQLGKLPVAVDRQAKKDKSRDAGGNDCEKSGLPFIHG
jgi:hypothetical protein